MLQQRVAQGECKVVHVPDECNPADFLTKFVPAAKLSRSLAYVTGSSAAGIKKTISKSRKAK